MCRFKLYRVCAEISYVDACACVIPSIPLSPIHRPENKFDLLKNPLLYLFHKKGRGGLTREKKLGPPAHL